MYKTIRENVKRELYELFKVNSCKTIKEWFQPPFEEDTILVNWISDDLNRTLRIQIEDELEDGYFDAFWGKSGIDNCNDDLCIILYYEDSLKMAEIIYEFYQLLFINVKDFVSINNVINKYN